MSVCNWSDINCVMLPQDLIYFLHTPDCYAIKILLFSFGYGWSHNRLYLSTQIFLEVNYFFTILSNPNDRRMFILILHPCLERSNAHLTFASGSIVSITAAVWGKCKFRKRQGHRITFNGAQIFIDYLKEMYTMASVWLS